MAYQPKSYKKFVATAATATLVASAVVPVAFAAQTAAEFSDVAPQYKDAVAYLVDNAIAAGKTPSTFGTAESIIRVDAAIWIAKATLTEAEIKAAPASTFTDVPARGKIYVDALKSKGYVNGSSATTFNSDANISRGEVAMILAEAYDITGNTANNKFTDVNSRYLAAVSALKDNGITTGKTTTKFGTGDAITRGELAIWVHRLETLAPATPEVVSVSAINLKQVEVKFNSKVTKATAEAEGNYFLNNAALADGTTAAATPKQAKAVLSTDGKSVVITLADKLTNNAAITLRVDGVENEKGIAIDSKDFAVKVADTTLPTVSSVEYTADGLVVLNFSEFLDQTVALANTTVRVNGSPVTSLAYGSDGKSVEVTVALTKGSTNSVYAAKFADLAGNEMSLFNGTVVAVNDETLPTIQSITQAGQNTARFVFSEPLNAAATLAFEAGDVTVLKGATTYTNGVAGSVYTVTKNTTVDSTGKTYDVTLSLAGAATPDFGIFDAGSSSQSLTFLVGAQTFADIYSNKNAALYSQSVTFNKDVAGPTLVSSKVADDKQTFEFTFNEDISATTVPAKVTVVNKDGVLQTVSTAVRKATDNKTLQVDLSAGAVDLTSGSYTITLGAGTVADALGNDNAIIAQTLVVGSGSDAGKPTVTVTNKAVVKNTFTATFNEEVTTSALVASNYTLDGAALPAGTTLYFTDSLKKIVEITLPSTNSVNIGDQATGVNGVLSVKNVVDVAGNATVASNHTVKLTDNTAATLTAARLLGDTLELTFNENLSAFAATELSAVLAEFNIVGGATALIDGGAADTVTTTVSNNKITFAVTNVGTSNWAAVKAAATITVETATPALTDANGVAVKNAVKVNVVK